MKYRFALIVGVLCLAGSAFGQTLYLANSFAPSCGQSTTQNYKGLSEIDSFSVGGAAPASSALGSGAGKLTLTDLVIMKQIDRCSTPLLTAFLTGQVIPTLTVYETKTERSGTVTVLTVELENAIVDSYNLSDSGNGSEAPRTSRSGIRQPYSPISPTQARAYQDNRSRLPIAGRTT